MTKLIDEVEEKAIELLRASPRGLTYSQLMDGLTGAFPLAKESSVRAGLHMLPKRASGVLKPRRGLYMFDSALRRDSDIRYTHNEQGYYEAFADFVAGVECCTRCITLGGKRLGVGTPDIIGRCAPPMGCILPCGDIIIAGELKFDSGRMDEGFGQACGYKAFAHKSYLAVSDAGGWRIARIEEMCIRAQVGLCVFDPAQPGPEGFTLRIRAIAGAPDMHLLNEKLEPVREELWPEG